jgi:hypothetical protein
MSTFLAEARQTVASSRDARDGLLPPLLVALTVVTGLVAQNSTARKLAVPDLTTTVLTLTITGIAADSPVAGALLVLRVHIVHPLVIALIILAAVAVLGATGARNPRTSPHLAT